MEFTNRIKQYIEGNGQIHAHNVNFKTSSNNKFKVFLFHKINYSDIFIHEIESA